MIILYACVYHFLVLVVDLTLKFLVSSLKNVEFVDKIQIGSSHKINLKILIFFTSVAAKNSFASIDAPENFLL